MTRRFVEIAVAVVIIALTILILVPVIGPRRTPSPEYVTDSKLRQLEVWITVFYWRFNELPDMSKWDKQLLAFSNELQVESEHVRSHFVDAWDNPVVYLPDSDGFILYSFGENQSDDGMLGDDIVVTGTSQDLHPGSKLQNNPSSEGP